MCGLWPLSAGAEQCFEALDDHEACQTDDTDLESDQHNGGNQSDHFKRDKRGEQ